jgi:hypothetical protein
MRTTTPIVAILAVLFLGCGASVRRPAQSAVLGALDAFEQPPANAELAQKLGKLVDRYVDQALAAEPPPSIEDISASATRGALRGLGQTATESGPALSTALSGSLRMAAGTLAEQSPFIGRIAGRAGHDAVSGLVHEFGRDPETLALLQDAAFGAGRAMTSGAAEELAHRTDAWVGPDGRGPLGNAISAIAARSAEYAVVGALAAIRHDFQSCVSGKGELCLSDMTRSLSSSVGRGASEGIKREIDWLTVGIAFAAGLVAAILAGVATDALRNRRRMRL